MVTEGLKQSCQELAKLRDKGRYAGIPTVSDIQNKARDILQGYITDDCTKAYILKVAKAFRSELKALRRLALDKNHKAARGKVYRLLNSMAARTCAVLLSQKTGKEIAGLPDLQSRAFKLDCRKPSGEYVRSWPQAKSSGGWRPLSKFGPTARGCQRLVLDILRAWMGDSPFEFARKGRGRDKAIKNVLERIRNGGARWFITADIKDFFRHIDPKGLGRIIPLPRAVIENVIAIPLETYIHTHDVDHIGLEFAVRQGIPQGSLVSPFIAAKVIEAVLQSIPARVSMSYIDNLLLGWKTKQEAQTMKQALAQMLSGQPFGPLLLRDVSIFKLGRPNDYLGYRIHRRWPTQGGYAYAHPAPSSFDKMIWTLRARLETVDDEGELLNAATDYLAAWLGSQGAWERNAYAEGLVMDFAEIEAANEHSRRHPYVPPALKSVEEILSVLMQPH